MQLVQLQTAFDSAPALSLSDILHTKVEASMFRRCMIHCIMRIVVDHGGENFKQYRKDLDDSLPATKEKISVHKTHLYPLPALNIDESTIVGNGEVVEAIFDELHMPKSSSEAVPIEGDHPTYTSRRCLDPR
jgi:hypothetical protein